MPVSQWTSRPPEQIRLLDRVVRLGFQRHSGEFITQQAGDESYRANFCERGDAATARRLAPPGQYPHNSKTSGIVFYRLATDRVWPRTAPDPGRGRDHGPV